MVVYPPTAVDVMRAAERRKVRISDDEARLLPDLGHLAISGPIDGSPGLTVGETFAGRCSAESSPLPVAHRLEADGQTIATSGLA